MRKAVADMTSSLRIRLLHCFFAVVTVGCASNGPIPQELKFTTHISNGQYKLFQLTYPAPTRNLFNSSQQYDPGEQYRARRKYIRKMLDQAVLESNYCREGYRLLARYAGETSRRIRGECREKATAEDIKNFPNTLPHW